MANFANIMIYANIKINKFLITNYKFIIQRKRFVGWQAHYSGKQDRISGVSEITNTRLQFNYSNKEQRGRRRRPSANA